MIKAVALALAVLAITGAGLLAAQDAPNPPPQRELYGVLAVGDRIYEPGLWLAGGQEYLDRTLAYWTAQDIGGTSMAEYLHFDEEVTPDVVASLFTDDWFANAFIEFDTWTNTGLCTDGSSTLYEFDLTQDGVNYQVRYWVEAFPPLRVLTFQMLFPLDQAQQLETYAARYKPSLPACP